jgi:hypothetical protein
MARHERAALTLADFAVPLKANLAKKARWLAFKNLVDYFIPFLPMSQTEVLQAVERQLELFNCSSVAAGKVSAVHWSPDVAARVASTLVDSEGLARVGSFFGAG